ncbi:hypothetical protein Tco_0658203 [Tanacetum coccineum]
MAEYSQKWHNGTSRGKSTETSDRLATIQAQLNNLGREIKKVNEKVYAAQVGCEQCKGPHYTKDYPRKEEGKTLEEAYYTQTISPEVSSLMTLLHEINEIAFVIKLMLSLCPFSLLYVGSLFLQSLRTLPFEPLTLSLTSMPSCDLESLTNILILCLILKASNQSLRKSLSLNLELS